MMSLYEGMLPNPSKPGHIGYYPVSTKKEWEDLPDLYKVMQWQSIRDPHSKEIKAVKSVIFTVTYLEPYGINAQVSVHPSDVQKILFCNYEKKDCLLYSVSGIELDGGTRLTAKWLQDSTSGAFAILSNGTYVGIQGGFRGFVPDTVRLLPDGTFKHDFACKTECVTHYELSNPFRYEGEKTRHSAHLSREEASSTLDQKLHDAASRTEHLFSSSSTESPERNL